MRLLDSVAACRAPLLLTCDRHPTPFEVAGPSRFAAGMADCPLRFVLGDDLTRASAELAFADGARLAECLDLLRLPATRMWVEWNDEVHKRVVYETHANEEFDSHARGRKVGVLLQASMDGLTAVGRTFWADAMGECSEVNMAPLETHIDLRGGFARGPDSRDVLAGGYADITHRGIPALASLLDHVRFRFDESWAAYYRSVAVDPDVKRQLIRDSLATVGWDVPFLLAFILLLNAKDATRQKPVSRGAINHKRMAQGRTPLLDHIEVNASLDALSIGGPAGSGSERQSPRLHHVRGHLVRREQRVFWRSPHLRGSGCRGMVRSRTVCLSFVRHEVRV